MSTYDFKPEPSDDNKHSKTKCRKCGADCTWLDTLLMDDGRRGFRLLHVCNVTDDFDDLTKAKP